MIPLVVDLLEVIEVAKQDSAGPAAALGPQQFAGQGVLEHVAVVQTGQGVGHRQLFQLLVQMDPGDSRGALAGEELQRLNRGQIRVLLIDRLIQGEQPQPVLAVV